MLGDITSLVSTLPGISQWDTFLNTLGNQFAYHSQAADVLTGYSMDVVPPPLPPAPPSPVIVTQVPGTSVYSDATGQPYTPAQMSSDWWSATQGSLQDFFDNLGSSDNSLLILLGSAVLIIYLLERK